MEKKTLISIIFIVGLICISCVGAVTRISNSEFNFNGSVGSIIMNSFGNTIEFTRSGINYIQANNPLGSIKIRTGGENDRIFINSDGETEFYKNVSLNDGNGLSGYIKTIYQDRFFTGYNGDLESGFVDTASGKKYYIMTNGIERMQFDNNNQIFVRNVSDIYYSGNNSGDAPTELWLWSNQDIDPGDGSLYRSTIHMYTNNRTSEYNRALSVSVHEGNSTANQNHVTFYSNLINSLNTERAIEWNWRENNTGQIDISPEGGLNTIAFYERYCGYFGDSCEKYSEIKTEEEELRFTTDSNNNDTSHEFTFFGNNSDKYFGIKSGLLNFTRFGQQIKLIMDSGGASATEIELKSGGSDTIISLYNSGTQQWKIFNDNFFNGFGNNILRFSGNIEASALEINQSGGIRMANLTAPSGQTCTIKVDDQGTLFRDSCS